MELSVTLRRGQDEKRTGRVVAIRDVTHHKTLEQEQAQEQALQLLETLFSQAPMGMAFLDRDLRFLRINERLAEMNGLSVAAHLGRTVAEILPTLDATLREVTARILATGQPVLNHEFSGETARAPGVTRHWNESWYPVRDEHGEIIGFSAVVEDVTERKRAEEQLRLHRQLLETTVNHLPAAVALIRGSDLTFQMVNPGYQAFAPHKQMVGRTISEVWPEQMPLFGQRCGHVLETGETIHEVDARFENRRDCEGPLETTYFTWSIRKVNLLDEVQPGLIITCWETTESKKIEVALAERTALLSGVLEGTTDVIFVKDLNGRTQLANAAFAAAAGSTPEQLVGKTDADWFPPDVAAAVRQQDEAVIASGSPMEFEETLPVAGEARVFHTLKAPLRDGDGRVVGLLGIGRDITERKHIELSLIAATAEAEKANRAKSDFLSNMSHELRTPLNALIGFTGLLIDSPLGRRQREYADKLNLSAQTLRALIDDILDFRRIEAGELRLENAPLSLNAILHTTAEMLGVNLRNKPVEAFFDVAPDVPDALVGDALRLQQILLNLTSNAAKFTQAGEIVVSVRCLASAEPTPSGPGAQVTLEFTVRDTGIGILGDQVGAIFNAFVQADSSTSRLYGGAGLGLSISAQLAELMGGRIEVDSNPGQGSEFRLRVPLTPDTREQPTDITSPPCAVPSAMRILIVDDHALSRSILCRTCASFGWQAKAVDSGAAALAELLRSAADDNALEDDYDLLLLDWRMPVQDGVAMLRQAYATPGMGLPLVILMAPIFELEEAVAASDDLHLDGIVAKPVTPASLREVVRRAYKGEMTARLPHVTKTDRRLTGMRLLVAEDNDLNQQVIEQILSRAGAEVVIAANGLAAVTALKVPGARFDAVLMDIQMPVMDGYIATRAIRAELGMTALPIIALTAYARPEDQEKSRLAGMVGHLVKPINVEDLLHILSTQCSAQPRDPATAAATDPSKREGAASAALAIELPGLDVETGLLLCAGDATVYGTLLRKFAVQHGQDVETARRLICANDARGAAQLMHELSGVAGFMRAAEVARQSAALEQALRDGDSGGIAVLLEELQQAMQTVWASIDQFEARAVMPSQDR